MDTSITVNELCHHGTKGQRWGVRRYQNRDGTLTPLGKKRAEKLKKEYLSLVNKKQIRNDKPEAPKLKSVSEMSDQELQQVITRKRLEQQYAQLTPKQVSAGKKIVDNILMPAASDASKKALSAYLEKQMKKMLNIQSDSKNDDKKKNKK